MATNITLEQGIYNQVVERARAANMTADEWLNETAKQRLELEDLGERTHKFAEKNRKDMARLGVEPSDVAREIANYRRGR